MPKSKARKPVRGVAKKARHKKVLYLPLDRESVARVSIQFRMALEVARAGQGDASTLRCLGQAVAMAGLIAHAGHGDIAEEELAAGERAILGVLASGDVSNWGLGPEAMSNLTAVINEHDRQLRESRLDVVATALDRIERRLADGVTLAELLAIRGRIP